MHRLITLLWTPVLGLICAFSLGATLTSVAEAHALQPQSPASEAPDSLQVEQALAAARARIALVDQGSEAASLRAALERLIAALERQAALLEEQPEEEVAAPELPETGPISLEQFDALRAALAEARDWLQSAELRVTDAGGGVDDAIAAVAAAQRELRLAREQGEAGVAEAEVQLQAAQAELDAERLERRFAEEEVARAKARVASLSVRVDGVEARAGLSEAQLAEVLAGIDRARQDLEMQLQRAQGNLEFASERLLAARRRQDEQGRNAEIAAEISARALWRDVYRRETDVLTRAIERTGTRREVWEIRSRVERDGAYRRDGEAVERLREIEGEVDRARRALRSRLEDARAQVDRAAEDMSSGGEDRWADESLRASAHLVAVLEQERRRLDSLVQTVGFAIADARMGGESKGLGEHARSAWKAVRGFWTAELFEVEERSITVGTVISGIVLLLAGLWIARLLSGLVGRVVLRRLKLEEGAAAAIQAIVFYVLLVTIALFALRLVNVPLTVFTVLGGALAIGIGFGSQNLMNNFISGLIILAERPIRVGDLIEVGDLHGIVQSIGARSTRVLTPRNIDIIVPNSSFLESNVTNWTLTEDKIRSSVRVGVAYGSPAREVMRILKKAAEEHGKVMDEPSPIVLFEDFGNDALIFELIFWLRMRRMLERRIVESDLRFRINDMLKEAKITIAFPQRDVHLDTLSPLDVRVVSPAPDEARESQEGRESKG